MKKIKGFTLIELIVVIAIIGVLASILVPTIMNYVTKSRIAIKNAEAKTFFTNVQQVLSDLYDKSYSVNGTITGNGKEFDFSNLKLVPSYSGDLEDEFKIVSENFNNQKNLWACYIVNTSAKASVCTDKNSVYAGGFPKPCPAKKEYRLKSDIKTEELLIYALNEGDDINGDESKPWPSQK